MREYSELERIKELEIVIVQKEKLVKEARQTAQREVSHLNEVLEEKKRLLIYSLFVTKCKEKLIYKLCSDSEFLETFQQSFGPVFHFLILMNPSSNLH